ncbi:MAG: hypothetical protein AB7D06_01240 [Pedobacter sp.]
MIINNLNLVLIEDIPIQYLFMQKLEIPIFYNGPTGKQIRVSPNRCSKLIAQKLITLGFNKTENRKLIRQFLIGLVRNWPNDHRQLNGLATLSNQRSDSESEVKEAAAYIFSILTAWRRELKTKESLEGLVL